MTPATSPTLMKKDISRYWDVPNVFIKIAGEMASLTAVEEALYHRWPADGFAVVGATDEKRGEEAVFGDNFAES